ncbi:MAG: ATP-binding protein, partial [Opitutaceae bacterium]
MLLLALDPAREAVVRAALDAALPGADVITARDAVEALETEVRPRAFVFAQDVSAGDLETLAEAEKRDGARRWVVIAIDSRGSLAGADLPCGVIHLRAEDLRVDVLAGVLLAAQGLAGPVGEISRLRGDLRAIARKISHEFRSRLGCIITNADLLTEILEDTEGVQPMLAGIAEAAGEITSLVDRVSLVTRASGQPVRLQAFPAGDTYWEAWENAGALLRETGAEIVQPDEWPEVRGVPVWCALIWHGLIENAARHGGPRPRIEVAWKRLGGDVRFDVRDFGPGVPARKRVKLFLPFSRLAESDSAQGLTLTLLERLASLQYGKCGYDEPSDDRGGSCFFFTLPGADADARPAQEASSSPAVASVSALAGPEFAAQASRESGLPDELCEREHVEGIAQQAHRSDLLTSTAAALLKSETPRDELPRLLTEVAAGLGMEIHLAHVLDPVRRVLRLESSTGLDAEAHAHFAECGFDEMLCGAVAKSRESRVLENLDDQTEIPAVLRALGVRAVACHPLRACNRILGTLAFASTSRSRFDAGELRAMQLIAELIPVSLDRASLLDELRTARDNAEEASRAKDDFMAMLSHELRTPLNPILLLSSEAAADESLPAGVRADFEAIGRGISLEAKLIDSLLDVTRITRGKLVLDDARVDVHEILRDALAMVEFEAGGKQIVLDLIERARRPVIRGDGVRMEQVFWNILKNAVKFTPEGGCVQVTTENDSAGEHLLIRVQDTGIGLTEMETQRIFNAFTQGDAARHHLFGGLGLGLASAKSLVEM